MKFGARRRIHFCRVDRARIVVSMTKGPFQSPSILQWRVTPRSALSHPNKTWDHKCRVNYGSEGRDISFRSVLHHIGATVSVIEKNSDRNTVPIYTALHTAFTISTQPSLLPSLCASANFVIAFRIIFIDAEHISYFTRCTFNDFVTRNIRIADRKSCRSIT